MFGPKTVPSPYALLSVRHSVLEHWTRLPRRGTDVGADLIDWTAVTWLWLHANIAFVANQQVEGLGSMSNPGIICLKQLQRPRKARAYLSLPVREGEIELGSLWGQKVLHLY